MATLFIAVYSNTQELKNASDSTGEPVLCCSHVFRTEQELRQYVDHNVKYIVVPIEMAVQDIGYLFLNPSLEQS